MKRFTVVITIALTVAASWGAFQAVSSTPDVPMSKLMPQGALVYLEAKDLSSLLRQWNDSPQKQAWLKSDNYEVVSRSRLVGRLAQAQSEFATAAGVPPDFTFLQEVAGERSAIAIYDIGKLELLYVSRVASAKSLNNALWQNRAKFEPRESAGKKFFVRTEPESGRVVAFALEGDYLILGTREDLVAGTLSLLAGQKLSTLHEESWFTEAMKNTREPGELRLLVHLAEVTQTPHFRTYWVQQNITDLRQYESSVSDLYRSESEYREERTLLLKNAPDQKTANSTAENSRVVADVLKLAPSEASFYKAGIALPPEQTLQLLESKILTPHSGPALSETVAPVATLTEGTVGSSSDLETRIDQVSSAPKSSVKSDEDLRSLLQKADVRAVLELHRSESSADGVFVRLKSVIVLSAANDWDESSAQAAVQRVLAPGLSAGQLGLGWARAGNGQQSYFTLNGLHPVVLSAKGKYLVLGNDIELIKAVLGRTSQKSTSEPVLYAAKFDHQRERQNYFRLTSLIDRPSQSSEDLTREPQFFSQNIAGLSKVFEGVRSESLEMRRNGVLETQTVRYEWSR